MGIEHYIWVDSSGREWGIEHHIWVDPFGREWGIMLTAWGTHPECIAWDWKLEPPADWQRGNGYGMTKRHALLNARRAARRRVEWEMEPCPMGPNS